MSNLAGFFYLYTFYFYSYYHAFIYNVFYFVQFTFHNLHNQFITYLHNTPLFHLTVFFLFHRLYDLSCNLSFGNVSNLLFTFVVVGRVSKGGFKQLSKVVIVVNTHFAGNHCQRVVGGFYQRFCTLHSLCRDVLFG